MAHDATDCEFLNFCHLHDFFEFIGLLEAKDGESSSRNEQVSKLKAELGKTRASMKKSNVLNLEMEAYEKSSKEMTQKLENKVVQLAEVRKTAPSRTMSIVHRVF